MKNLSKNIIPILPILILVILGCSQSDAPSEMEMSMDASDEEISGDFFNRSGRDQPGSASSPKKASSPKMTSSRDTKESSTGDFEIRFSPLNPNSERMLEYEIFLEFESEDFGKARNNLYKLAEEFGFLQSSSDSLRNNKSMHASVWVKKDKIYEFLQVANQLGKLRSENIRTTDLTYENFQKEIILKRESIRGSRRARGLSNTDNKTYAERERLLTESEDKEDKAKMDQWNIQDRVKWAKVSIQIIDPRSENKINVPDFSTIFYDFVSGILYLAYILIYLTPVFIVLWILWKKTNIFKRKKEL